MLRRLNISLLALSLTLIGLLLLGAGLVLYTERGLQFAVSRLPQRLGSVAISLEQVGGTIAGGFTVRHVVLEHERALIRAENVSGRVAVLPLIWQTISVQDARISSLWIEARPRRSQVRRVPRFLPPLLRIDLPRVRAARGTLIATNGQRFDAEDISASGVISHKTIRVFESRLILNGLRGEAQGAVRAAQPLRIEAETRWSYAARGQPEWVINVDGTGDLDRLEISGAFTAPFQADFTGEARDLTSAWHWRTRANVRNFDLRAWGGSSALGRITGTLELRGDKGGFVASGPLDSAGLGVGLFDALLEGKYANRVVSARRLTVVHRTSRARLGAQGEIGIIAGGPQLALKGHWKDFRWPLDASRPSVKSASGEFSLSGIWPYKLAAAGAVSPLDLPAVPARVSGSLHRDRIIVDGGEVQLYDGRAKLSGEARWTPQETWKFAGSVVGLNPGRIRADLPGSLDFQWEASGESFGDGTLDLKFHDLKGRLRRTAASGRGHLTRAAGEWRFDRVNVAAGGAALSLDGRLGATRSLVFRIDAADLGILDPESRGTLHAEGTIRGTTESPQWRINGSGRGIRHNGIEAAALSADIELIPGTGNSSRVSVKARDLRRGERTLNQVDLTLDGRNDAQRLALDVLAGGIRLKARAEGASLEGSWRGRWRELRIDDDKQLHMTLESATAVRIGTDSGALERLCLKGVEARVCAEAVWDPQAWSAAIGANALQLSALAPGTTPTVTYEGQLALTAGVHAKRPGVIQGALRIDLRDAQLRRNRGNGRVELAKLGTGFVTANLDETAVKAELRFDAGANGLISGELRAERVGADWDNMPLRGSLRANTNQLGLANLYFPEIDRASGRLSADTVIGGVSGNPLVNGVLRLADGELDLYQVNLALRKVSLEARILDNRLEFKGAARAGDGELDAAGDVRWTHGDPVGTLSLKGRNLLLVNVPEARISASPDLRFDVDKRHIDVTGQVTIPFAKIAPADLAGAVRTSADEVVVASRMRPPKEQWAVAARVRLVLGDAASIDTFGLSGRLGGALDTRLDTDGASRGTGELTISEGKYAAFGRRLDVERGKLIFSGGLLTDPGVDIRATKQFPDAVAGVNVRGTLRQPRMTFFSEPSMPQSQIVSLILAGGSIATAQNVVDATGARGDLLAQGGAILAQQLGQKVGLEDVSIEQNLANETAVVLGKYLSPRLYVSYGISLTESLNTVKMRYSLSDRWTIRTEAGRESGADLVYTIEK